MAGQLGAALGRWQDHAPDSVAEPGPEDTPVLRDMMAAWTRARGDRPAPMALDFPLERLGPSGAFAALVELSGGPGEARYRAAGPGLVRLWGRDMKGLRVADIYGGAVRDDVLQAYAAVAERGAPAFAVREFRLFNRAYGYRRLLLPLVDGQGRVVRVVTGLCPSDPALLEAVQWRVPQEEWQLLERYGEGVLEDGDGPGPSVPDGDRKA